MSDSKQQQQQLDALTEARELFLEAEFDQALAKFKEAAAAAAGDKKRWPDALAAETGQAEVRIQQKDWPGAVQQLTAALASAGDASDGARDLTRARYMLGIALLGQRKTPEARVEFDTARRLAEAAPAECRALLPDIQDRLAQIDEEVEEDDLMEIAMEFGVTPEEDDEDEEEYEEEEELEGEEDEEEDEEEEEEEDSAVAAKSRKRRAAAIASRANGGDDDDEDEDEEEEDFDEDEEEEAEAAAAGGDDVPQKRARMAAPAARNGRRVRGAGDDDDEEEEEEEEEVSSSA